jgi:signal transduction histidine kinase
MLANLLDNAIKYTPSKGSIQVDIRSADNQSGQISVKDTGIGISEKDLPHIFERFYRCDPSRSQAGTGLGLSFARAVARAHKGDITVSSTPDKGSTFTVIIPKGQHEQI